MLMARLGRYFMPDQPLHVIQRGNKDGAADPLLSDHPLYLALGADAATRAASYRALFSDPLPDAFVTELREATNGGWALGSDKFKKQVAAMAQRRAAPLAPGRPPEPDRPDDRQGELL